MSVDDEFGGHFHILEANLSADYGEAPIRGIDGVGTPYAQGNELSGTCAQAVCFIANALLLQHAEGLYGISEVTAIASDELSHIQEKKTEVILRGLNTREIEAYFKSKLVGLRAATQERPLTLKATTSKHGFTPARWLESLLRSYILSGMPVIIPVDQSKLGQYVNAEIKKYGSSACGGAIRCTGRCGSSRCPTCTSTTTSTTARPCAPTRVPTTSGG